MFINQLCLLAIVAGIIVACNDCPRTQQDAVMIRYVRRSQPNAVNASLSPQAPLQWGQLNFLHTSDTHGWLEGHPKEASYGADWGDFLSFTESMKRKAKSPGVDLLLIDTGVCCDDSIRVVDIS
jgi:2',3'-cyclic-nucleotide 2'-phosphodiesterase (5'-nucleotidase family)